MKLATFQTPDGEVRAGKVHDDHIHAFGPELTVAGVLAGAEANPGADEFQLDEVTLLAPVPDPVAVYGIGLNYAKHIQELDPAHPMQTPEFPIVFVKVRGSVAPPAGPIRCPEVVRRLDYEGELAIVIGQGGAIAGFCVADDVTARDLQGREPQWTRAKGADTFCPIGPWITTADEIPDPADLRLRTWVNEELRQDSNTSDLIFSCAQIVEFIGETCTLRPGDLILTGTPSGTGVGFDPPRFLDSGDRVRVEIDRLGAIEHSVG